MCEKWIQETLPANKETFSRDAVEVLMKIAYEAGVKEARKKAESQRRYDEYDYRYGDL